MLYQLARRALFSLDPETAHDLTLANIGWAARCGLTRLVARAVPEDPVELMGLRFRNAVGLAAGMDKEGAHLAALGALGFGHIEAGTVTPLPQPGNPKPRVFRIIPAQAVVNRMGFNNAGVDQFVRNVAGGAAYRAAGGIVGLNIGKNAATPIEDALSDYRIGLAKVYTHADYVAVNISSPNTKNLRALQGEKQLEALLAGLAEQRKRLEDEHVRRVPIAVKIAPDLADDEVRRAADALVRHGLDAIIATNTTLSRAAVQGLPNADEAGGLSGRPLTARSTEVVALLARHLKGRLPIIGVGGIMSGEDAVAKMQAGASLVQLYTGFIYSGPDLVGECVAAIAAWRARQRPRRRAA
ncbi:MAG: hypothetical protein RI936_303 [Pseudomonadota bacterium]